MFPLPVNPPSLIFEPFFHTLNQLYSFLYIEQLLISSSYNRLSIVLYAYLTGWISIYRKNIVILRKTNYPKEEWLKVIYSNTDAARDLQIPLYIIKPTDLLCVIINYMLCDGTGFKESCIYWVLLIPTRWLNCFPWRIWLLLVYKIRSFSFIISIIRCLWNKWVQSGVTVIMPCIKSIQHLYWITQKTAFILKSGNSIKWASF